MVPTFILTRTFAISALFVGAAPLSQAAPTFGIPGCMSRSTCDAWLPSTVWTFIAAIIPFKSSDVNPPHVGDLTHADDLSVLAGLYKKEDLSAEKRETDINAREFLELRQESEVYVREARELENRTAEPEDLEERTCEYVSECRRDEGVIQREEGILYAREPNAEAGA